MKAIVDRSGCIGCGLCAEICPDVFKMDGEGLSEVVGEVNSETESAAKEAAETCPVTVISIEE